MSPAAAFVRFLSPPRFDDVEKTERARMLYSIAIGTAVLVTLVNALSSLAAPELASRLALIAIGYDVVSLGLIAVARRGWVDQASVTWLVAVWAIATWTAWTGGGVSAPAASLQLIVVVLAGLLLGWRANLVAAALAVAVLLALWQAEAVGALPIAQPRSALFRALTLSGYATVLAVLSAIAMRSMERLRAALGRERDERAAQEHLREKDAAIRRAYTGVIEAVTGGRLLLVTPEECRFSLGVPVSDERDISLGGLGEAIAWLREALPGVAPEQANPALLIDAAGEALTNAVKHAEGGRYQLHRRNDCIQFRVTDQGPGIDFENLPKATLVPGFSTTGTLGYGFDIMLKRCNRVLLSTQPGETTVVLEVCAE